MGEGLIYFCICNSDQKIFAVVFQLPRSMSFTKPWSHFQLVIFADADAAIWEDILYNLVEDEGDKDGVSQLLCWGEHLKTHTAIVRSLILIYVHP